ncbi:hypothetical protein C1H46_026751 [Malus baccata]|uniref:Cysteine-rich transmembrane CYSTM domain-containing protein n=1 Tax=Malus baccata TaxID=106549 RepID=A0A540LMI5_MALBA|nr:hypothetical protein C1H46_026751 [Malus baccata]
MRYHPVPGGPPPPPPSDYPPPRPPPGPPPPGYHGYFYPPAPTPNQPPPSSLQDNDGPGCCSVLRDWYAHTLLLPTDSLAFSFSP